ncbi:hypothetical protein D3Y59_06240 [Hymenobacter oligotrophus]|uniref:DUF7033 domain-containing protein n=1 Tax=Hymenobacter oligotrophus TaxID=2319843 RepID=A0A3B7QUI3_9BACT|nr:polysaccharide deacetylase family protein [Hymenobacter oligotrophus]AYA36688.1 hypothetical protein D3Y59_06240 [Hymenobacter oligotrophus]
MPTATSTTPKQPVAARQSQQNMLAYVLRHFWMAYEAAPLHIGYGGLNPEATVQVEAEQTSFFEQAEPYPAEPLWREWAGCRLPFFFQPELPTELITLEPGRATIHADVVANAFYLLSGWQEYYSPERDHHGRFPYRASVQQRYQFVTVPVVNYYFDLLRTAVEHVLGHALPRRAWPQHAPFACWITHDVDNCRSGWKAEGKKALRAGQVGTFVSLLTRRLGGRDAWDNLDAVQREVAVHGQTSSFFMLGNPKPAPNGTPNADYDVRHPRYQRCLQRLRSGGAEIGVHGSIGTSTSPEALQREISQLPPPIRGNRFHYLSWEPQSTPAVLDAAGVQFDTTLGFAEHFGFRHSYCLPFWPYNFATGGCHRFLEIPLNLMDATLHHPNYLQLGPEEILPTVRPMLAEIERFGGVFTLLWHNENFSRRNHRNGPKQFHALVRYLRGRHAAFVVGSDVLARFAPTPA